MSVTDFAEHLGAARRTVAKWSSQGDKVQLRADMQAALDTVLMRAAPDARERFEALRRSSTTSAPADPIGVWNAGENTDTGGIGNHSYDSDGDVRRRDLLRGATVSGITLPGITPLLNALVTPPRRATRPLTALSVRQFGQSVASVKNDYQACRYERVFGQLAALLPALESTRSDTEGEQRARIDALTADLYHVVGSVLLKVGDPGMALIAAERSTQSAIASQDPVAVATSARIMTHALMRNGHTDQALHLVQNAASTLDRDTRLASTDAAVAVYGALVLRGAVAAARADDRDTAQAMLDEASRAAARLGHDGNDRWTGFGATNVQLHRINIVLSLGDAGTTITLARQVPLHQVTLTERKASLFVDVARAYTQWGRYEQGLHALRTAYDVAPEEVRCRPAVRRVVSDLMLLARGRVRTDAVSFVARAGIGV